MIDRRGESFCFEQVQVGQCSIAALALHFVTATEARFTSPDESVEIFAWFTTGQLVMHFSPTRVTTLVTLNGCDGRGDNLSVAINLVEPRVYFGGELVERKF